MKKGPKNLPEKKQSEEKKIISIKHCSKVCEEKLYCELLYPYSATTLLLL